MINQTKFTVKKPQQPGSQQKKNTEPFNSHKPQITNHKSQNPLTPTTIEKTRKKTQQAASSQAHKFSDLQILF